MIEFCPWIFYFYLPKRLLGISPCPNFTICFFLIGNMVTAFCHSSILSSAFFHPHFVIRVLSCSFCHLHFIIRIFSSALYHLPSTIRHPVRTLQRPVIFQFFECSSNIQFIWIWIWIWFIMPIARRNFSSIAFIQYSRRLHEFTGIINHSWLTNQSMCRAGNPTIPINLG